MTIGSEFASLMTKDDESPLNDAVLSIRATLQRFKYDFYRALWIQGTAIVVAVGIIVVVAIALG